MRNLSERVSAWNDPVMYNLFTAGKYYWFQLLIEIIDIQLQRFYGFRFTPQCSFSFFSDTSTHTHRHTCVGVPPLYLCFSIFTLLCFGLAPLDVNQGRNDGEILSKRANTPAHSQMGFSSTLWGDRVVCLLLIGVIQPIHGKRARERLALYKILDFGYWRRKNMEVILFHE